MKSNAKNLFILALVAFICMSAARPVMRYICEPAKPVSTVHNSFTNPVFADLYIEECIKAGYTIKIVAPTQAGTYGGYQTIFVVAEKY